MNKRMKEIALLALASSLLLPFAGSNELATGFDCMLGVADDTVIPHADRIAEIETCYRRTLMKSTAPHRLATMEVPMLHMVFRASALVEAYTFSASYLDDMRRALNELEKRGAATDEQRTAYYRALIGLRDFDAARRYLARHPWLDVEVVPTISRPDRNLEPPVVFAVSEDGQALRPYTVAIAEGAHLIVVSHSLCAFSRRAMQAIAEDAEFRPLLPRITWLAPVEQRLHLDAVSAWNRTNPGTRIVLARRRDDWPMIDEWDTPQFYLVRNGRLAGKLSGWPAQGHRDQLMALLKRNGMLPQPAAALPSGSARVEHSL